MPNFDGTGPNGQWAGTGLWQWKCGWKTPNWDKRRWGWRWERRKMWGSRGIWRWWNKPISLEEEEKNLEARLEEIRKAKG